MRAFCLLLLPSLIALLSACATADKDSGAVSDRPEPTTGTRITRRDQNSDVRVMTREEVERTRGVSGGTPIPPRN